jgi:signal transduction histidine kinase
MDTKLVERLKSLKTFSDIPRNEVEWLVRNGSFETYNEGTIVAPKGKPIEYLFIILSGKIAIRVDRGIGPKLVTEWKTGEVTGMLPYSRMRKPPGNSYVQDKTECVSINVELFPEMIHRCPTFTAFTVHSMLDRVRNFNSSDLYEEKMASFGKLASGLAHELNNPASALIRDSKMLIERLSDLEGYSRMMGAAGLLNEQIETFVQLRDEYLLPKNGNTLSPLEKSDLHDKIVDWLIKNELDPEYAIHLVDTEVTFEKLQSLTQKFSGATLNAGLRWLIANCSTRSLAHEIEHTAIQIHKLVDAVKKFTYLDQVVDVASVDIISGIKDTIRVLESKAVKKNVTIDFKSDIILPKVSANGSDLNQVWLCLIDNALDAVPNSGRILITGCTELDRVTIRITDNGPGIPQDNLSKIFEPFFTTKPPGYGIGLGLDIARRLLRRYHGDISVQSLPGNTEFTVSLVIADTNKLSN